MGSPTVLMAILDYKFFKEYFPEYEFNGDRILTIAALSEVVISFDALSLCRKSKAYLFNGNIKLI